MWLASSFTEVRRYSGKRLKKATLGAIMLKEEEKRTKEEKKTLRHGYYRLSSRRKSGLVGALVMWAPNKTTLEIGCEASANVCYVFSKQRVQLPR